MRGRIIFCALLSLITCGLTHDAFLYEKTIVYLNECTKTININLLEKSDISALIPKQCFFDVIHITDEEIRYQLGENINFAFKKNKRITVESYCSLIAKVEERSN